MPAVDKPTEGQGGWEVQVEALFDAVNAKLDNFDGAEDFASQTVSDPAALASILLSDSTGGSVGTNIVDAGASYSQANANNNFASLVDQQNKMRNEINDLRNIVILLLDALRKSSGVGALDG